MGTLANSEDLDEMLHISSEHIMFANLKTNTIFWGRKTIHNLSVTTDPFEMYNGTTQLTKWKNSLVKIGTS